MAAWRPVRNARAMRGKGVLGTTQTRAFLLEMWDGQGGTVVKCVS